MKKIIAVAVASAFVAPAFAAEVTVGGHVEYTYVSVDGGTESIDTGETEINISATEELSGGVTVTAKINLVDDGGESDTTSNEVIDLQGSNLTFAGSFGSVSIGDNSGALDSAGDYSDVAPSGGSFQGDGNDSAITYTLPSIVENLTLVVSASPAGANDMGTGTGVSDDMESYSATYNFGMGSVYAGSESYATNTEMDAYGAKVSMNGFTVAMETADLDANGTKYEISGAAITYTMGDIVFGMENQEYKQKGTTTYRQNEVVTFAEYNWGPVDLYVSIVDVDDANAPSNTSYGSTADSTRVGVEYVF